MHASATPAGAAALEAEAEALRQELHFARERTQRMADDLLSVAAKELAAQAEVCGRWTPRRRQREGRKVARTGEGKILSGRINFGRNSAREKILSPRGLEG